MKRVIIYGTLILIVILAVWWAYSLKPKGEVAVNPNSAAPTSSITPPEGMEFNTTNLSSMDKNKKQWEMTAKVITVNEKTKKARAKDVKFIFFDPKKKPVLRLAAKGADVNLKDESIDFDGTVTAKAATGEVITVKKMRWDGKKKKLLGMIEVKLTRKGSHIIGKSMEADPALRQVEIKGNVKIYLKEKSENVIKELSKF